MTAVNQVFLIGRIGQGPEVKYTKSGVAYCQVNLAVNRTTKDAAGNIITDWIPLQVWDKINGQKTLPNMSPRDNRSA